MGVRWYVAYPLSYRHIEERMEEGGVEVDHSTIQRWVVKYSLPLEASFQRGKSEAGMDAYQGRTWEGWHRHMVLSWLAVWFLIGDLHRGQQVTPALTLPPVRYGLSLLLLEVYCTPGVSPRSRAGSRFGSSPEGSRTNRRSRGLHQRPPPTVAVW